MATVELLENAAALIELLTRVLFEGGLQHMYIQEGDGKETKSWQGNSSVSSNVKHQVGLNHYCIA